MAPCAIPRSRANRFVRRSQKILPHHAGTPCRGCADHAVRATSSSSDSIPVDNKATDGGYSSSPAVASSRNPDDAHNFCELWTGNAEELQGLVKAPVAVALAAVKGKEDYGENHRVGREEDETETENGYDDDALEEETEDDDSEEDRKEEGEDEGAEEDKELPTAECATFCGKRVRFNLSATSVHEVIPYAEIYGAHPRTFVFDADSRKIPAGRGGFISAPVAEEPSWEADDDAADANAEDGGWESWLLEQDEEDSIDGAAPEIEERTSRLFSRGICVPDLDEETGWESWLDSVLSSNDDQVFYDPTPSGLC